jgi:hypothetical protein
MTRETGDDPYLKYTAFLNLLEGQIPAGSSVEPERPWGVSGSSDFSEQGDSLPFDELHHQEQRKDRRDDEEGGEGCGRPHFIPDDPVEHLQGHRGSRGHIVRQSRVAPPGLPILAEIRCWAVPKPGFESTFFHLLLEVLLLCRADGPVNDIVARKNHKEGGLFRKTIASGETCRANSLPSGRREA